MPKNIEEGRAFGKFNEKFEVGGKYPHSSIQFTLNGEGYYLPLFHGENQYGEYLAGTIITQAERDAQVAEIKAKFNAKQKSTGKPNAAAGARSAASTGKRGAIRTPQAD